VAVLLLRAVPLHLRSPDMLVGQPKADDPPYMWRLTVVSAPQAALSRERALRVRSSVYACEAGV
jgi:hypothetical protein